MDHKALRPVFSCPLNVVDVNPLHQFVKHGILYDYRSNITGLNVLNHLLKAGTVEIRPRPAIVHILTDYMKPLFLCVLLQDCPLESGLSRGDYPNYIFFECVNYPLSICSDGRQ